jgi:predicted transcriptional regulator
MGFVSKQLKTVRIKPADLKQLARIAQKEDETMSSLIQRAIREFLERRPSKANRAA